MSSYVTDNCTACEGTGECASIGRSGKVIMTAKDQALVKVLRSKGKNDR
jgi:RecJ-like exonuclease